LLKKIIYDITPFTTTDYKDHLSCIAWFITCNMRCPYCYNPDIVNCKCGNYSVDDLITFLKKRVGLLDGVVLSGGEATNHNLIPICEEIKKLKFKIKLDTNGSNPKLVKKLVDLHLIDYIALDYKATDEKFNMITNLKSNKNFIETLTFLIDSKFDFEVRTTIHPDLLNENDINCIILDLKEKNYQGVYYLQKYLDVEKTLGSINKPKQIFNKALLHKEIIPLEFRNW